ncbi:MAG: hypothetical protein JNM72_13085 [Deltaproteobacteria bacterium]|nr:hypothetical protein [Deltaproteobacteria bacterium]
MPASAAGRLGIALLGVVFVVGLLMPRVGWAARWSCGGRERRALSALRDPAATPADRTWAQRLAARPSACGALQLEGIAQRGQVEPRRAAVEAALLLRRWPDRPELLALTVELELRAGELDRAATRLTGWERRRPRAPEPRALRVWLQLAQGELEAAARTAELLPAGHPAAACAEALRRGAEPADPACAPAPAPPRRGARAGATSAAEHGLPGLHVGGPPPPGGLGEALAAAQADWRAGRHAAALAALAQLQRAHPGEPALALLALRWGPKTEAAEGLRALLAAKPAPRSARPLTATDAALGAVMGRAAADLALLLLEQGDVEGARAALEAAAARHGPSPALVAAQRRVRAAAPAGPAGTP